LKTVAVIALKGGSGKTTVATHLALAAYRRGVDVLVVDVDPQHSAKDVLSSREEPGPDCVVSTGPQLLSAKFAAVGLKKELMIIDTPAALVEEVGEALVLADYAVMVVRPTLLDIAGLVRTFQVVKKMGKPCCVVINQAPAAREGVEAPMVKRALRGLEYMQAPVAPAILRARTIYQTALERGWSAEELPDRAARQEIAALWKFVQGEIGGTSEDEDLAENLDEATAALGALQPGA
jgi:chromosome partitioning protein